MEDVPLKEARQRLGKLHAEAAHGRHVRITRHAADAVVLMPEADYQEYQALKREKIKAEAIEQIEFAAPYVERGETPPGYVRLTREQIEQGELLA
jgi:prevent-host-death family protein